MGTGFENDRQTARPENVEALPVAVAAPSPEALSSLQNYLGSLTDARLRSSSGVLEILRSEFSVATSLETLKTPEDVTQLKRDLSLLRNPLLQEAVNIAATGLMKLEKVPAELPSTVTCRYDEPINTFRGALHLLDYYLDDTRGNRNVGADAALNFKTQSWTSTWNDSVEASLKLQKACLGQVEVDGQRLPVVGESAHKVIVYDVESNFVCGVSCLNLESSKLGHDRLKSATVPASSDDFLYSITKLIKPQTEAPAPTREFMDTILPLKDYRDRTVAEAATVERSLVFLPIDPNDRKSLFSLAVTPNIKGPLLVDIVTGQNTCEGKLIMESESFCDTPVKIVLPSRFGMGGQEYFQGTSYEALGEKRQEQLQRLGAEMSSSVIVIFKPAVNESEAAFRREVLHFKTGNTKADGFSTSYYDRLVAAEREILEKKILDEPEYRALCESVRDRKSVEEARARTESLRTFYRSADYGGGMKGGGGMMMGFGGLATGSSGMSTGEMFGKASKRLAVDPWTAPKICVFRIAGVGPNELVHQEALLKDLLFP